LAGAALAGAGALAGALALVVFAGFFLLETALAGVFFTETALVVFADVFLAGAAFDRVVVFFAAAFFTGFTRVGEDFDVFPADFTVFLVILPPWYSVHIYRYIIAPFMAFDHKFLFVSC
jgi:hypothetical protein